MLAGGSAPLAAVAEALTGCGGDGAATARNLLYLIAAGVLAPVGILLHPAVGAVLMSLSTVIVAVNAQLLRRTDLQQAG